MAPSSSARLTCWRRSARPAKTEIRARSATTARLVVCAVPGRTCADPAELAVKAGVKKLILTHISRRYREKEILKEAQAIFPNTSVARDFDSFQIKREE